MTRLRWLRLIEQRMQRFKTIFTTRLKPADVNLDVFMVVRYSYPQTLGQVHKCMAVGCLLGYARLAFKKDPYEYLGIYTTKASGFSLSCTGFFASKCTNKTDYQEALDRITNRLKQIRREIRKEVRQ